MVLSGAHGAPRRPEVEGKVVREAEEERGGGWGAQLLNQACLAILLVDPNRSESRPKVVP